MDHITIPHGTVRALPPPETRPHGIFSHCIYRKFGKSAVKTQKTKINQQNAQIISGLIYY